VASFRTQNISGITDGRTSTVTAYQQHCLVSSTVSLNRKNQSLMIPYTAEGRGGKAVLQMEFIFKSLKNCRPTGFSDICISWASTIFPV
jgi:hypothetical protein